MIRTKRNGAYLQKTNTVVLGALKVIRTKRNVSLSSGKLTRSSWER